MKVNKIQTSLELWRMMRPFLPEDVRDMRVEKITVKFKLNARGGTEAEAHTMVVLNADNPYEARSKLRKDKIMDPYGLYNTFKARIDLPESMVKLDVIMDPNKGAQINFIGIPTLREGQSNDGNSAQQ